MIDESQFMRWAPVEPTAWSRIAYGRRVTYVSEGGTLSTSVRSANSNTALYLKATIEGRMLVEVYANGKQIYDELVAHDDLDCFIKVPKATLDIQTNIEVHFIPATTGEVRILRSYELVCTNNALNKAIVEHQQALKIPA